MKHPVSDHIDQYLNSLDQVKRASAPAYFYTRLRARMEKDAQEPASNFQLQPALILLAMMLLLGVNSFLVLNPTPQPTLADTTEKEELQHWTNEYAVNDQFPINESYTEWVSNK